MADIRGRDQLEQWWLDSSSQWPGRIGERQFYVLRVRGSDRVHSNELGGTSFAAPMWAGYAALVNQQLAAKNLPAIGFLNPTIYAQNVTASYATDFHDIPSGTSGRFSAVLGYDLVTGQGTPNGSGLINALVRLPQPRNELPFVTRMKDLVA